MVRRVTPSVRGSATRVAEVQEVVNCSYTGVDRQCRTPALGDVRVPLRPHKEGVGRVTKDLRESGPKVPEGCRWVDVAGMYGSQAQLPEDRGVAVRNRVRTGERGDGR